MLVQYEVLSLFLLFIYFADKRISPAVHQFANKTYTLYPTIIYTNIVYVLFSAVMFLKIYASRRLFQQSRNLMPQLLHVGLSLVLYFCIQFHNRGAADLFTFILVEDVIILLCSWKHCNR